MFACSRARSQSACVHDNYSHARHSFLMPALRIPLALRIFMIAHFIPVFSACPFSHSFRATEPMAHYLRLAVLLIPAFATCAGECIGRASGSRPGYAHVLSAAACIAAGQFLQSPTDSEPVEGSRLSLSCSTSDALFTLWRKKSKLITPDTPGFTVPAGTGGNSSYLIIESANHTLHTGNYECVAVFLDSTQAVASFKITVRCKSPPQRVQK